MPIFQVGDCPKYVKSHWGGCWWLIDASREWKPGKLSSVIFKCFPKRQHLRSSSSLGFGQTRWRDGHHPLRLLSIFIQCIYDNYISTCLLGFLTIEVSGSLVSSFTAQSWTLNANRQHFCRSVFIPDFVEPSLHSSYMRCENWIAFFLSSSCNEFWNSEFWNSIFAAHPFPYIMGDVSHIWK